MQKNDTAQKQVGVITMGQAARSDLQVDIDTILAPELEIVGVGIVDGLTKEEIDARYAPAPGEPYIVSMIENQQMVSITETHAKRLIQEKINALDEMGIHATMLLCTCDFGDFQQQGLLLQPPKIIEAMLSALSLKKIGVLVPEEAHIAECQQQYQKYAPLVYNANPYQSMDFLAEQAKRFVGTDVQMILMDCMGYTKAMGETVKRLSGKKVLVPRVLTANILKTLA